jgi:glycosyltransferase involved in cell wall biosynthesis
VTGPRIAVVVASTAGGTGRHAAMLAAGCAARGMPVAVAGPAAARTLFTRADPAGAASPGAAARVSYAPLEIAGRPRPARDAAAVLRLRRLLTRWRPDVAHAHGLRAAAVTSLALAGTSGPRPALLVTVHNAAPAGVLPAAAYRALERLAARRADAVLCVSPDLAGRMSRAGAREVELAVVAAPAAAPPPAGAVGKARADIGAAGRPVVLALGRLAHQKGFDVLVDAAARLRARDPAPVLAIAGEGPMQGPLAGRARAAGADVRFLGMRSDVPALLAAADVVAVPSRWEGQPLVVQEALQRGRPLVASRVGGIPGLTGENAALLVPPGDPGALAGAIASVIGDPALARSLGAAAAARARDLPSPAAAVDAVVAVYLRLAAARSQPAPM